MAPMDPWTSSPSREGGEAGLGWPPGPLHVRTFLEGGGEGGRQAPGGQGREGPPPPLFQVGECCPRASGKRKD